MIDIDKHLNSYHDGGNDYRYVFSREEVVEIKKALEFYESALKNEDGYLATICERNWYNKAIDDFLTDIINKINFEDKWLFDCKSNNADTDIAFSALRTFVNERAEQLKAGGENDNKAI